MQNSFTEENYLKIIHSLSGRDGAEVSTNALAESTSTRAASVTDMLRKLADKGLIHYKKYQGVTLTETGEKVAIKVIRKHRLWEVFLVEKLGFGWTRCMILPKNWNTFRRRCWWKNWMHSSAIRDLIRMATLFRTQKAI
jgi:Mn-dependent DtxR family transcriptional regulator